MQTFPIPKILILASCAVEQVWGGLLKHYYLAEENEAGA
jgi:hypothetical protein